MLTCSQKLSNERGSKSSDFTTAQITLRSWHHKRERPNRKINPTAQQRLSVALYFTFRLSVKKRIKWKTENIRCPDENQPAASSNQQNQTHNTQGTQRFNSQLAQRRGKFTRHKDRTSTFFARLYHIPFTWQWWMDGCKIKEELQPNKKWFANNSVHTNQDRTDEKANGWRWIYGWGQGVKQQT